MQKALLFICGIVGFFLAQVATAAGALPFLDIQKSDVYYDAVSELYEAGIISDDGSHRFRPDELMRRDFYVSLAV